VNIAGAENRGKRKPVEAVEDQQRMVHVLIIVAVKETQLLVPMGGVVGGVHIQYDPFRRAEMRPDVQIGQEVGEAAEIATGYPVLKPADGRLTGQIGACLRQSSRHDLERRIAFERIGVIGVFITQRDGKDTLPHQADNIVERALPITTIMDTERGGSRDAVAFIDLPKQQTAAVRGHATAVKTGDNFLTKKGFKTELFMADCFHKGVFCL